MLQGQASSKGLEPEEDAVEAEVPAKGGKVWGPLTDFVTAFRPLLSSALRRTTLLLLLIWFVNALCYYGLVLLTTSVRATHFEYIPKKICRWYLSGCTCQCERLKMYRISCVILAPQVPNQAALSCQCILTFMHAANGVYCWRAMTYNNCASNCQHDQSLQIICHRS